MEPYDLEIGPIQRTFDELFKDITEYFNSVPTIPKGTVTETELSSYSQDKLHDTLHTTMDRYGFNHLPHCFRINMDKKSQISGIRRSDNITTYKEKLDDQYIRTYNFYGKFGPENMKVSFYWFNRSEHGEETTHGILTSDNRWYLYIITSEDYSFYLRMEQSR